MYRENDLMNCLHGLAGWRQNTNPDYESLAPSITTSISGLYFQEVHPLVNLENIDQCFKNYDYYNYPAYTENGAYAIGDKARYSDNKVYEATVVIAAAPAVLNPAHWTEVKLRSQKLEAITRSGTNKIVSAVVTGKKMEGIGKSIFENIQLFGGVGDLMNKVVKEGRFVGLEIRVKDYRDISVFIRRIGTQFSLANPDFKLYLFHSSQPEPVQIIDMNLSRANAFSWTDSDVILRYLNSQQMPGGAYYLGYYEDDLLGMAINKGYDFSHVPCGTCNNDLALYNTWSSFVAVKPFSVSASYLVDKLPDYSDPENPVLPILWDLAANQWAYVNNFGLNLDLTVGCDITDTLCRERRLLTDAILKQVAVDVLLEIAYSTRNNVIAKEVRDLAIYALEDQDKNIGLKSQLEKAIKAVSFDFSDLSDICLPCENNNGLSWGAY
jgi:hypothetical protein